MIRLRAILLFAAIGLFGCDETDDAIYDGYRLVGTVVDSTSGAPIESVGIFVACPPLDTTYNYPSTMTSADGQYQIDFFPQTGPGNDMLRFAKDGYRPRDFTVAEAAIRVKRFRYQLDVVLARQP